MENPERIKKGEKNSIKALQKIIWMFFYPSRVFKYLNYDRDWFLPMAIFFCTSCIFYFFSNQVYILELIRNSSSGYAPDNITGLTIGITAVSVIGKLLEVLLGAAFFFFAIQLLGGTVNYVGIFSIFAFTTLISVLNMLFKLPLILLKGTTNIQTSLAVVVPTYDSTSALFRLLSRFDLFLFWELTLICLGVTIFSKVSMRKVIGLILGVWIFITIIYVLLGGEMHLIQLTE
jgi:hypothetical protein